MARGKAQKYKKEILDDIRKLANVFCANDADIAAFLGVRAETFCRWKKKHPELTEYLSRGKAQAKISLNTRMVEKAKSGNVVALIFVLTNKFPDEWQDRRALVNNVNINRMEQNSRTKLSDDELRTIIKLGERVGLAGSEGSKG